jgi:hypothetical protein
VRIVDDHREGLPAVDVLGSATNELGVGDTVGDGLYGDREFMCACCGGKRIVCIEESREISLDMIIIPSE